MLRVRRNPASVKATPAGVSTLVFMDLELVRPDNLTGASSLPTGVNASLGATTLTFTNRKAANGGVINGTIMVAPVVSGGTTTFTETLQPDRHSGSAGERGHAGLDLVLPGRADHRRNHHPCHPDHRT